MSEKLVSCGECVHWRPMASSHFGGCSAGERSGPLSEVGDCGPHDCPSFAPSPLARIADALETLRLGISVEQDKDGRTMGVMKTRKVDYSRPGG
jgi:hypothetical protein